MSVGSGLPCTATPKIQQAPADLPSSTSSTTRSSSHMPHAITSQDGTITINIRQPETSHVQPHTQHVSASPSQLPPRPTYTPRTHHIRDGSAARHPRPAREVFYSSDPNEEFVDSEMVSVFMDKKDLRKSYEKAVYHGK